VARMRPGGGDVAHVFLDGLDARSLKCDVAALRMV